MCANQLESAEPSGTAAKTECGSEGEGEREHCALSEARQKVCYEKKEKQLLACYLQLEANP